MQDALVIIGVLAPLVTASIVGIVRIERRIVRLETDSRWLIARLSLIDGDRPHVPYRHSPD